MYSLLLLIVRLEQLYLYTLCRVQMEFVSRQELNPETHSILVDSHSAALGATATNRVQVEDTLVVEMMAVFTIRHGGVQVEIVTLPFTIHGPPSKTPRYKF